jgi:dTDP-glucose 4,6-dehydratase
VTQPLRNNPAKTILVTGGAGFIGANFVLGWPLDPDSLVITLDKLTYAGNLANLHSVYDDARHLFVRGDIADKNLIGGLLEMYQPRVLVNFAAETHVDRSIDNPASFIETNVTGTMHLLHSARAYWESLTGTAKDALRFLHISTDEVYGSLSATESPFRETHPYRPNSPYAASKAAADHLVRAWHHTYGLPVITTNCSNNYGPFQFPEKLIPLVIENALTGKPLPLYGDGLAVRDWLYVDDHCAALHRILEAGTPGQTYAIGGNNQVTGLEVVKTICAVLDILRPRADGQSYETQIAFVKDRPGHDRRYAMDTAKIEGEMGWQPAVDFATGIRITVQWYLDNRGWVENVTSGQYREWMRKQYA